MAHQEKHHTETKHQAETKHYEKEHTEEKHNDEEHVVHHRRKKHYGKMLIGILAVLMLILIGGLAWLYTGNISTAKEKVFASIPLPAAIVETKFVPAKKVIERIKLSKELLESQGIGDKANSGETYQQVLDAKKLEAVASSKNVKVTSAELDEEYNNIISQYAQGDEETFRKELLESYKMSPEEFKKEVISQQVMQSNLLFWYNSQESLNTDAFAKAKDLQGKISGGQSFDDVAKVYTQDEATKDFAGDSGMISFDDLLPEFRTALTDGKTGDIKLTPSRYGLHILKILDLNNNGENGGKQIHLQQIFVQQKGFEEWLKSETESVKVYQLLKFS